MVPYTKIGISKLLPTGPIFFFFFFFFPKDQRCGLCRFLSQGLNLSTAVTLATAGAKPDLLTYLEPGPESESMALQ